jgi:hypothetical protein
MTSGKEGGRRGGREGGGGRKGGVEGGGGRAWEEGNVHRKCLCGDDKFILMD